MRAITKRKGSLVAVLAVAGLLLGACGGDDDNDEGLAIDSGSPTVDGSSDSAGDATTEQTDGDCISVEAGDDDAVDLGDLDANVHVGEDGISIESGDDSVTVDENGNVSSNGDLDVQVDGNRVEVDIDGDGEAECFDLDDSGQSGSDDDGDDDGGDDDDEGGPDASGLISDDADYTCNGDAITVDGQSLNVDLGGSCASVTVNGNANNVNIVDAGTVSVNGQAHNVDITGSVTTIDLSGNAHNLDYAGNPAVNDNSVASNIN